MLPANYEDLAAMVERVDRQTEDQQLQGLRALMGLPPRTGLQVVPRRRVLHLLTDSSRSMTLLCSLAETFVPHPLGG